MQSSEVERVVTLLGMVSVKVAMVDSIERQVSALKIEIADRDREIFKLKKQIDEARVDAIQVLADSGPEMKEAIRKLIVEGKLEERPR